MLAAVVGAAGCGGHGGGHGDALASVTQCLRDQQARPHALPAPLSNPLRESGWRVRTFEVGTNDLVVVAASSDAAAGQARRRLARAVDALDPTKPAPHQLGKLVYVWDERPSPANQAVVRHCLG